MGTLDDLREEIRTHAGCGFAVCEEATQLVPGDGPGDASVVLVGEAPGANEDREGRPFVGRAGKLLDQVLEAAGLSRETVYVTNVVKARPPGNRDPKADEVAHHLPWLEAELALLPDALVVTLGRHALRHFDPALKISQVHGQETEARGRRLFPLYHPAAALRSPQLREVLFADARALARKHS